MAITQTMCTSFKIGLLDGSFNFGVGTAQSYYIALYTSSANLSASTTTYTSTGEAYGTGYAAYGKPLTISQVPTNGGSGTTAYLSFDNVTWSSVTLTARGALIYLKDNITNPAVAVIDFGEDKSASAGDFTVEFPAVNAANAIIRIA